MKSMINVCNCNICGKPVLINDRHTDKVIVAKRSMNEMRYVHHRCNVTSATNKETNKERKTAKTNSRIEFVASWDVSEKLNSVSAYLVGNDILKHDNHFKTFKIDNLQALSKIVNHYCERFGNTNIQNFNASTEHLSINIKKIDNKHITEVMQEMRKYEIIISKHNGKETKTACNCKERILALANEI